ncbi:MAG: zinc-ribbon and FHA domain-containing protein [Acidimicrobiales bacterium]|nr:zinc-ribbon and FHA domain-containing protein [Acidimicrobiales bacterium]
MTSIFCNRCGHRNPEGSNFCSSCGAVLERLSSGDPATTTITLAPVEAAGEVGEEEIVISIEDHPAGVGLLVVKRGPNAGSRFALSKDRTTIGRHPDSDIFLDDVTVSRRHAEVVHNNGRFTVTDAGSLNGTYLNRERIEQADMHSGDELQIGKFRLVFLYEVLRS